ncbi:hypothetical protein ACFYMO_30435 [Streptomyces sp. NPDC007025]
MTTCGIAGPALLFAIGFGTGFTIAAALSSTSCLPPAPERRPAAHPGTGGPLPADGRS